MGELDINKARDPITYSLFKEIIEEREKENLPCIVAAVTTKAQMVFTSDYFDAYLLLKYFYGSQDNFIVPSIHRYNTQSTDIGTIFHNHPTTKAPLHHAIKFYKIEHTTDPNFTYIGSDFDLLSEKANPDAQNYIELQLYAYLPNEYAQTKELQKNRTAAQMGLAYFYRTKDTVKDMQTAFKLYQLVIDQKKGSSKFKATALYHIGIMYRDGLHGEKDLVKGEQYFLATIKMAKNYNKKIATWAKSALAQLYIDSGKRAQKLRAKELLNEILLQELDSKLKSEVIELLEDLESKNK